MACAECLGRRPATLADVEKAICSVNLFQSGPILLHVIGFEAPVPYPKKFLYSGCSRITSSERLCRKSTEKEKCSHDPTGKEVQDMFRFDIWVVDGSMGGRPIRATIFAEAGTLLYSSVEEVKLLSEVDQIKLVEFHIKMFPKCFLSFRVLHREVTVTSISRDVPRLNAPLVTPSFICTPPRPRCSCTGDCSGSSATTLPAKSSRREVSKKLMEDLEALKFNVLELAERADD